MRRELSFACLLLAMSVPAIGSATVTLDFEDALEGPLSASHYEPVGARIEGGYIFHVPNLSWASARSGVQGMCPVATTATDGTTYGSILTAHSVPLSWVGGGVSDIQLVNPLTLASAPISSFSIGYGYDSDGGEPDQAVVIEAFDATGARVLDVTRTGLYYDGYETFSAPGAVRLRLTQNGFVGFDDLSFTPVPEPASVTAFAAGLGLVLRSRRRAQPR